MSESFQTGDVINGRFRLGELLLSNPAADVYQAEDLTLQRSVAVHVLPHELANDADFLAAFRNEAAAVASLSHPNILRVFDWGEEANGAYLVTEFPAGGSLRSVLDRVGTLSETTTALLAMEVADGLAYAHARGMVHGALSPATIHLDADGRAKVADFGVAQVIATTRLGSPTDVRYASPEQATGAPIDGRSDVYALALIMHECVTGSIPHDQGDAAATLRARVGTAMPHHPALAKLDMIVAQAGVHDASARLDAAALSSRLQSVASSTSDVRVATPAEPLIVAPVVSLSEDAPKRRRAGFSAPSPNEVLTASPATAPTSIQSGIDVTRSARGTLDEYSGDHDMRTAFTPRRNRFARLALTLTILGSGVGLTTAYGLGLFTPTHAVPSVVDLSQSQAAALLGNDHFVVKIIGHAFSNTVGTGMIVAQHPAAGTSLREGSSVGLTLSDGAQPVAIPTSVIGASCANATATLARLGVTASCPSTHAEVSTTVPKGAVIRVLFFGTPNPATVPHGATVTLVTSLGPKGSATTTTVASHAPRAVVNFVGMSRAQALAELHILECYAATTGPGSATGTWTQVVAQRPAPGTMIAWHGTIHLTVR